MFASEKERMSERAREEGRDRDKKGVYKVR